MWCGTDVQNCYLRRPTEPEWATVFRKDTFSDPATDLVRQTATTDGLGSNLGTFAGTQGRRAYACINGYAYTLDLDPNTPLTKPGGIKAKRWNLPAKWMRTNAGIDRMWGPGMSGHPINPDVCLLGTENDGAYYTLDAGLNVQQITLPKCSGGIGVSVKGRERILVWQNPVESFVFIQGTGLHRSTTGPTGDFTLIPGSPLHATSLFGEPDGTLWLTGDPRTPNADSTAIISPAVTSPDAGVWRLDLGSPTPTFLGNPLKQWAGYGPYFIAANPNNPQHVIAFKDQQGSISIDRGKSWMTTGSGLAKMVPGGEAAWRLGNMFVGDVRFTPDNSIFWGEGFGCLLTHDYLNGIKTNSAGAKYWDLQSQDYSRGIEEFIYNNIFVNPRSGQLVTNNWDRHACVVYSLTEYKNQPLQPTATKLSAALGMDVAIDQDLYFIGGGSGTASHSWTRDLKTLTPFGTSIFPPLPNTTTPGGCAGPVAMSYGTDAVIVQANNWPAIETRGRFNPTTGLPDRVGDWTQIELDGSTNYHTINAFYVTRQSITADKTREGVFAMVVSNVDPKVRNSTNNPLGGIWMRPNRTDPWKQTVKGLIGGKGELAQYWVCHLSYVPNRSGELLYTGYIGQAHTPLVHLTSDGLDPPILIPDVTDVNTYGFGRNPDTSSPYPAVLFRGKYKGLDGFWLTRDWFKTFRYVSDPFLNNYWSPGTPAIAGDMSLNGADLWSVANVGKGGVWVRTA